MTDLEKLAERVEALQRLDREIDADIWDALGLSPKYTSRKPLHGHWARLRGGEYHFVDDSAWGLHRKAPHYTASLDAAMTLVPEGWRWMAISAGTTDSLKPSAQCWPDGAASGTKHGEAAIPALALCAAALRAKAAK